MHVRCPHCNSTLTVKPADHDQTVVCWNCRGYFTFNRRTDLPPPTFDRNTTSPYAIVALILGLASIFLSLIAGIPALLMAALALSDQKKHPENTVGRGMAIGAIASVAVTTIIWGAMGALIYWGVSSVAAEQYDTAAQLKVREVKMAEELYYYENCVIPLEEDNIAPEDCAYSNDLSSLIQYEKNLTSDPGVTFGFAGVSASGYTVWTSHAKGSGKTFTMTKDSHISDLDD